MRLGYFECEVEVGQSSDEPGFVVQGVGINTGIRLTESQCEAFSTEYAEDLYMNWFEAQVDRADALADAWKDGTR